ncbi:CHAT domain-containing protein [Intrasporangium sp. YIM S08009]|uniref:CHAT domain-containing protein n=1 Tax=Intrasporangium zincisolvens TaxID=3080018 RepID=UPI002B0621A6|nr:CHAT domain-containing protein [Intrasporangium sp. YIM S08009]
MSGDYLDFDIALTREGQGYAAHVLDSPAGQASTPFTLPFGAADLARFMVAVGPPRVTSRRLVPAESRVVDVREYGRRLADALLAGDVGRAFRASLATATAQGRDLRLRLRLEAVPDLDPVPWEYLYDKGLERFVALSQETPVVRLLDALDRPPVVTVEPPLRVLVMVSSPSDLEPLAVDREKQLLRATTGDLVAAGLLEVVVVEDATLISLQRALLDDYHVFHFIGHGGFDEQAQEGVLALEHPDGTAHLVSGARLGTLLHDARSLQLAVLNACEGARTSGRDAFSGVGQALVRQGLPAVVAMQTEISDRAALVFSHEFYWFLTRGLGIDAAMCEVRKAMAVSDEAAEWGTAVLLRSGSEQPFAFIGPTSAAGRPAGSDASGADPQAREARLASLYTAAQGAIAAADTTTALPMLEQIAAERPDYADVTALIERVRPDAGPTGADALRHPVPVVGVNPRPQTFPHEHEQQPEPVQPEPVRPEPVQPEAPEQPVPVRPEPQRPEPQRQQGNRGRGIGRWVRLAVLGVLVALGLVAWRTLPSLLQKADPLVAAACGTSTVDPGATDFTIGCAPVAPVVDGSFDDWRSVTTRVIDTPVPDFARVPVNGLSATWQALWDKDALFLHAVVTDPTHTTVVAGQPSQWWRGDAVSFEVGPDPRALPPSAPLRKGKDFHVVLGLLDDGDRGAAAAVNVVGTSSKGQVVFPTGSRRPKIAVVARPTDTGYELEARVPWSEIGRSVPPARGEVLGFNVNVSDARGSGADWVLRTMLSSNPSRSGANQNHPGTWQTLALGDSG